jgi:hypothetical protein
MNPMPIIRRRGVPYRYVKTIRYFVACGESWGGILTKRDGRTVTCGHRHRTEKTAERCAARMRKTRPGNCQTYRVSEIHSVGYQAVVPERS